MRDSLVMYRSTIEASKALNEKQRLQFYEAIFDYALNDIYPEGLKGHVEMFFNLTQPLIDSNNRKYRNGCKGGRPSDDTSPRKELEGIRLVNLTETQYDRLIEKYNEKVLTKAIEELESWLETGEANISKPAKSALGKNHYCYFKRDKWIIQKAIKLVEEETANNQPNWSV